mmetsp:Transcript_18402/g.31330  ORF Transcript_18402/g.31330 Transcript_18402/m.31330 type:complete len:222 (-) Transcript_18402:81-746(-)
MHLDCFHGAHTCADAGRAPTNGPSSIVLVRQAPLPLPRYGTSAPTEPVDLTQFHVRVDSPSCPRLARRCVRLGRRCPCAQQANPDLRLYPDAWDAYSAHGYGQWSSGGPPCHLHAPTCLGQVAATSSENQNPLALLGARQRRLIEGHPRSHHLPPDHDLERLSLQPVPPSCLFEERVGRGIFGEDDGSRLGDALEGNEYVCACWGDRVFLGDRRFIALDRG